MMTREHWNQIAVVVTIIIVLGSAQWAISTLHERDMEEYSALTERVAKNETELSHLQAEMEQERANLVAFETELRLDNTNLVHQIDQIQGSIDVQKALSQSVPLRRR